jgi:hypothetical protein
VNNPTALNRPRVIVDTIEHRGSLARCPHCKRLADRLLIVDDGLEAGPALACDGCLARAGGPKRSMRGTSGGGDG